MNDQIIRLSKFSFCRDSPPNSCFLAVWIFPRALIIIMETTMQTQPLAVRSSQCQPPCEQFSNSPEGAVAVWGFCRWGDGRTNQHAPVSVFRWFKNSKHFSTDRKTETLLSISHEHLLRAHRLGEASVLGEQFVTSHHAYEATECQPHRKFGNIIHRISDMITTVQKFSKLKSTLALFTHQHSNLMR